MKAVILVSSIFYILGLKIGNKIDIVKKDKQTVQKELVIQQSPIEQTKKCENEVLSGNRLSSDSLSKGIYYPDALLKPIEF